MNREDFFGMLLKRESCRDFDSARTVRREDLESLLSAGCLSPSACNSQPWHFVGVQNETAKELPPLLCRGPVNRWTSSVGTFIVVCETKAKLRKGVDVDSQHFAQLDLGIATGFITLAATSMGLSTCILGCFDEPKLKMLLSIPDDVKIRLVVAVGYAKTDSVRNKARNEFSSAVSFDKY